MSYGPMPFLSRTAYTGHTATTATANVTLTNLSNEYQQITCSGGARTVTLPAYASSVGQKFCIANTSATALDITVADAAAVTVTTIGQNETGFFVSNGTTWMAVVTPSGSGTDGYALLGAANTFTAANTFSSTVAVSTADALTEGGVIVPTVEPIRFTIGPHATQTTYTLLNNRSVGWTVVGITVVPDLAQGGALTATIVKATANAAPASGTTPMHTANAIDCNATANTSQVITLTATGADLVLAATDKIGIVFSAALTTGILSGTVWVKRS